MGVNTFTVENNTVRMWYSCQRHCHNLILASTYNSFVLFIKKRGKFEVMCLVPWLCVWMLVSWENGRLVKWGHGQNRSRSSAWELLLMYHLCYRMTSACQSGDGLCPESPCRHLETCWDTVKGECGVSPSRWLCRTACGVKWLCQQLNCLLSKHRHKWGIFRLEHLCQSPLYRQLFQITFRSVILVSSLVYNLHTETENCVFPAATLVLCCKGEIKRTHLALFN